MSLSVSGTQLFGGTGGVNGLRPPPPPSDGDGGQSPIDAVTDLLGMSKDDITSALQQGKSLSDLATSKGVSQDDLISALKAGMPSDLAGSSDATQIAEQIASRTGLQGPSAVQGSSGVDATSATSGTSSTGATSGHHHHHRGAASQVSSLDGSVSGVYGDSLNSSQQQTLTELSGLLGSDPSTLLTQLRSGTSLADLVSSKGVDSSSLAGVIQDGLLVDTKS